ncbi:MAG: MgtC/SapB family protein [Flexilinea sp.]|nr:MgtC/SapB family protein [Flexilinea sp.]
MLTIFDPLRNLTFVSLLARLLTAVFCGTCIGLERSAKNRPAGFRTHILVCLGGAVASLTGHYMYLGLKLPADITRLSGQVITGLGFIGAGTIIVTKKMTVKGLTTAAGLWTTGIIGLAIGSGFFEGGLLGTALVLVAETIFPKLRQQEQVFPDFALEILYDEKDSLDQVMRYCKDKHIFVKNLRILAENDGASKYSAILELRGSVNKDMLVDQIRLMPGIVSASEK